MILTSPQNNFSLASLIDLIPGNKLYSTGYLKVSLDLHSHFQVQSSLILLVMFFFASLKLSSDSCSMLHGVWCGSRTGRALRESPKSPGTLTQRPC